MVGTANGIATSIQMLGIGICNIIVGRLMSANSSGCGPDTEVDYLPTMKFFLIMACCSVVLSGVLKLADACGTNRLRRGQRDTQRFGSISALYVTDMDD